MLPPGIKGLSFLVERQTLISQKIFSALEVSETMQNRERSIIIFLQICTYTNKDFHSSGPFCSEFKSKRTSPMLSFFQIFVEFMHVEFYVKKGVSFNDTTWKVSKYGVFSGPYSVRMRENTDQKKLRIWTLFTQCDCQEPYQCYFYPELKKLHISL